MTYIEVKSIYSHGDYITLKSDNAHEYILCSKLTSPSLQPTAGQRREGFKCNVMSLPVHCKLNNTPTFKWIGLLKPHFQALSVTMDMLFLSVIFNTQRCWECESGI